MEAAACQKRLVGLQDPGTDPGHQGNHLEDRTGFRMHHQGRQGHRTEGIRQAGIDPVEESSAAVVDDRQCLVGCPLVATGVVVPVAHASRQLWLRIVYRRSELGTSISEGRQRKISTRFCALGGLNDLHPKILHHRKRKKREVV
jgi:hypothetical protein